MQNTEYDVEEDLTNHLYENNIIDIEYRFTCASLAQYILDYFDITKK